MLIVAGEVKLADVAEIDAARDAIVAMMASSNAEEGCILYAFSQDLAEPTVIRIIEKWQDQAALDAHFEVPHMAAFMAALANARVESVVTHLYDAENERAVR